MWGFEVLIWKFVEIIRRVDEVELGVVEHQEQVNAIKGTHYQRLQEEILINNKKALPNQIQTLLIIIQNPTTLQNYLITLTLALTPQRVEPPG